MTDKEKKSKIADILMDFQEEYSNEVINRPMLASLYAGNILSFIDSLQEEPISEQNLSNVERIGKDWKEEPVSEGLEEDIEQAALKFFPLPPCYNEEQRKSKDYADSWYRARDEQNGFKHGAFWCKRHFVNAACEWLRNRLPDYWYKEDKYFNISGCIYEFKDAMMKK